MLLLIAGAVLELLGLALVAYDVARAKRERDELSRLDQVVEISPATERSQAFPMTVAGGGRPPEPTLEDRVERLEREAQVVRNRLDATDERIVREHRELTDRLSALVGEARRETRQLRHELRPLIGDVVAGNLWLRAVGVGLFALGVVVQTIANVAAL